MQKVDAFSIFYLGLHKRTIVGEIVHLQGMHAHASLFHTVVVARHLDSILYYVRAGVIELPQAQGTQGEFGQINVGDGEWSRLLWQQ